MSLVNLPTEYIGKRKLNLFLDHLSLSNDLKTWHSTDLSKKTLKQKLDTKKTGKVSESLYHWFSWQLQPSILEKLPSSQSIIIRDSEEEMRRKSFIISESCRIGRIPLTYVNDVVNGSHYWNFDFFVHNGIVDDDPEFKKLGLNPAFFAYSPSFVKEDRKSIPYRIFPIHIDGFFGTVFIRVSKVKGSFPAPMMIGSGDEFPYLDRVA